MRLWVAPSFCIKKCDSKKSNCSIGVQEQQKRTERVQALEPDLCKERCSTAGLFFCGALCRAATEKIDSTDKFCFGMRH